MKKGKSRNKRKKTRSRLLWIAIAVIGIAAVISAVCVAGMLATKENAWRTPEELLVEYMDHIPKQEYEEMYAMLHIEASGNVSQEDFVTRNSAIYEGIEVQNMAVQIIAYDEEQMAVTYQTSFDTVAGTISFENEHKLILTTKATKDITKRYGGLEKLGDKLLKNATMEESLGEVIWLIALLANQEILIHNLQHRDEPKPLLTEDEIELLTNPYELAEYKDAIMAAMLKGTKRHVESMPEKNEKGNAQTGQSHQK